MRKLVLPLAIALVAVAGAGTVSAATTKTVKGTSTNRWSPSSVSVAKGDKIRFTWNNTGAPHDVRKTSGRGGRLTANKISNRGSATFTVPSSAKRGARYAFICTVHATTMKLTAKVR